MIILYNKLSTQKKQLIKSIDIAKKQENATLDGIANELDKQKSSLVDKEAIREALFEAEKIKLAQKTLISSEDKPTFAWRSLMPEWSIFLSLPLFSKFFK